MRRTPLFLRWLPMPILTAPLALLVLIGLVFAVALPLSQRIRPSSADAAPMPVPAPIDGNRAFKYLTQICEIGPRPAGSAANAKQRALVSAHFQKMGAKVTEQPFTGQDPRSDKQVAMVNLVGSWHPERKERVVIGAHYDTRPFPDEERNPELRSIPFIGANDGASGVALLMEMAHHLKTLPTSWGIDLVLFDGEELVYGRDGEYFLGSKEFARVYVEGVDGRHADFNYEAGLVLDMVGGKNLKIQQEPHSLNLAPKLVKEVWAVARQLKATAFHNRIGRAVMDDHLPLNNGGIPTIDLIDFDYPYWHTSQDLPKNCSGDSMAEVGRVVTAWLSQPRTRGR
ncbi:M28 family peptidase [Singulisphaera acidiphila]|uniref:Putative aminopeptidase n=1 Tax=Singulisphaera acidiphila (strain ATCC BAA-1392 / DSM 18658 / VKM B-2454 / MOB10) TaxID=886293 RepID=L0DKB5_SINAD|nr:M28 family peptidase [Singulisphaera acidiphila]AGA29278.1 putative aminopeptidase [Singulisphaera acidiphila DSM 18658]